MMIELPWPSSELSQNARWPKDALITLKRMIEEGRSQKEIARVLGKTEGAIRNKVWRMGWATKEVWSPEDEAAVVDLYTKAGANGVLNLDRFAAAMGREKGNICRKARQLGLPISLTRKKVEQRKDRRMFKTAEELRAHKSASMRARIAQNGHNRGMLGKRHTQAVKDKIGENSTARWQAMTQEQRDEHVAKGIRTKMMNGISSPPKVRGTWKAGWREIGGKRNFYRSRWEANYARYLELLKSKSIIKEWEHEPETFWFETIRRGVRSYKPDFRVWENDGSSELHEVKGWMDDRSRVCLKRMAKYFPNEKIVVIDGKQYRAIRSKVMGLIPDWEDSKRDTHA